MTAHLVLDESIEKAQLSDLKKKLKHLLLHKNIHHTTLEFEFDEEACSDPCCEIQNEQEICHHHH